MDNGVHQGSYSSKQPSHLQGLDQFENPMQGKNRNGADCIPSLWLILSIITQISPFFPS